LKEPDVKVGAITLPLLLDYIGNHDSCTQRETEFRAINNENLEDKNCQWVYSNSGEGQSQTFTFSLIDSNVINHILPMQEDQAIKINIILFVFSFIIHTN